MSETPDTRDTRVINWAGMPSVELNNGCTVTAAEVVRFEEWAASIGQRHRLFKVTHRGAWSYRHLPMQHAFVGWMASHNFARVT